MLTRMWDLCTSNPLNNPLDAAFEHHRVVMKNLPSFAREMRIAILQYFSVRSCSVWPCPRLIVLQLCRQAGMQPEGLSKGLEATWISMSERIPVPPGSVTVVDSFPQPDSQSPAAECLAKDPSLSVYLPTLGKMKPTPPPLPGTPRAEAVISSTEPLSDTQQVPRCDSDGAVKVSVSRI